MSFGLVSHQITRQTRASDCVQRVAARLSTVVLDVFLAKQHAQVVEGVPGAAIFEGDDVMGFET